MFTQSEIIYSRSLSPAYGNHPHVFKMPNYGEQASTILYVYTTRLQRQNTRRTVCFQPFYVYITRLRWQNICCVVRFHLLYVYTGRFRWQNICCAVRFHLLYVYTGRCRWQNNLFYCLFTSVWTFTLAYFSDKTSVTPFAFICCLYAPSDFAEENRCCTSLRYHGSGTKRMRDSIRFPINKHLLYDVFTWVNCICATTDVPCYFTIELTVANHQP